MTAGAEGLGIGDPRLALSDFENIAPAGERLCAGGTRFEEHAELLCPVGTEQTEAGGELIGIQIEIGGAGAVLRTDALHGSVE